MKPSILYRLASILILLFAVGHTLGFRQIDPNWHVDELVRLMQAQHFHANGFERTYWDFYVGFGLFGSVFLLLAALVAWQLGGLRSETLAALPLIRWPLALCFGASAYLGWQYFFAIPLAFSLLIFLCLTIAALPSRRAT